jgi:hypothetical protein
MVVTSGGGGCAFKTRSRQETGRSTWACAISIAASAKIAKLNLGGVAYK